MVEGWPFPVTKQSPCAQSKVKKYYVLKSTSLHKALTSAPSNAFGTLTLSQALSPNISAQRHWCSREWMGANPCSSGKPPWKSRGCYSIRFFSIFLHLSYQQSHIELTSTCPYALLKKHNKIRQKYFYNVLTVVPCQQESAVSRVCLPAGHNPWRPSPPHTHWNAGSCVQQALPL